MRVLYIEDEAALADSVAERLRRAGLAVDVAYDGTDGLWMAREFDHDLILLDLLLPGTTGFEICAQLRQDRSWTPILVLTAKDGEYDQAEMLDSGADDYLTKPFSFVVLEARIRALLRRGAPERPTQLRVGDLTLDPSRRRATIDGDELELTIREWAILHYLAARAEQAVAKRDLLEHVWDQHYEGDPNIVEVYVSRLRRKVGRDRIRTVRGQGYRLTAGRP